MRQQDIRTLTCLLKQEKINVNAVDKNFLQTPLNDALLTGRPDIVFAAYRVAVFCDGDFWHGRRWAVRKKKLARGSNAAYRIAKRLYEQAPNADGVFVPCPRWPTITDVELLEREIGKPVVTSCQAYIWHAMRMAKVKETVTGFGRLMASLAN